MRCRGVKSRELPAYQLRKFGRVGSIGDQAINGFKESRGRGKEFDTDQIALPVSGGRRFQVSHAGIRNGGLPVEHQAHGLNRLDRERLIGFDQRAVRRKIVHPDRVTGIKRPPEGSEHFESHP